jgi:hypothetical protein
MIALRDKYAIGFRQRLCVEQVECRVRGRPACDS